MKPRPIKAKTILHSPLVRFSFFIIGLALIVSASFILLSSGKSVSKNPKEMLPLSNATIPDDRRSSITETSSSFKESSAIFNDRNLTFDDVDSFVVGDRLYYLFSSKKDDSFRTSLYSAKISSGRISSDFIEEKNYPRSQTLGEVTQSLSTIDGVYVGQFAVTSASPSNPMATTFSDHGDLYFGTLSKTGSSEGHLSWQKLPQRLATSLPFYNYTLHTNGSYLYQINREDAEQFPVFKAPILNDGRIGAWAKTTSLPAVHSTTQNYFVTNDTLWIAQNPLITYSVLRSGDFEFKNSELFESLRDSAFYSPRLPFVVNDTFFIAYEDSDNHELMILGKTKQSTLPVKKVALQNFRLASLSQDSEYLYALLVDDKQGSIKVISVPLHK